MLNPTAQNPIVIGEDFFLLEEASELSKIGSWYISLPDYKVYWNRITYQLLEAPKDYIPVIQDGLDFYHDDHKDLAYKLFFDCCRNAKAFNVEIKMQTKKGKTFWANAIGKPVFDDFGEQIGIQGVFQSIDIAKRKEERLKKLTIKLGKKNRSLAEYGHIVSHHLRSHTSNITFAAQLYNAVDCTEEKRELIDNIEEISKKLESTIQHLDAVCSLKPRKYMKMGNINFKDVLNAFCSDIKPIIREYGVMIHDDFSGLESMEYSYTGLFSIMENLIMNSIKFKHESRAPEIFIKTYSNSNQNFMIYSDNGRGVDLNNPENDIFKMFKTCDDSNFTEDVGLFLVKNQIEAMEGTIQAASEIGTGTTFFIKF